MRHEMNCKEDFFPGSIFFCIVPVIIIIIFASSLLHNGMLVPYLEHEIRDHSVEDTALVVKRLLADSGSSLLTCKKIEVRSIRQHAQEVSNARYIARR